MNENSKLSVLSHHRTHFKFGCAVAYKAGNRLKTIFRHRVMTPSNHFWILSSQFKQKKECLREIKTGQQLWGQRVPGCLRCLFCRNEEQSLLSQDGGYLNEACTSGWRQHSTDLILRLVPVFEIPVPQDHLKHREQTSNVSWMQPLCAFPHADMHFTWKKHRFCFCSASGFPSRALPGQTLAANRSSMLLSGYTLWQQFALRISWTVRCTFDYRYARRLGNGRLWPVTDRVKKRKPLKQPQRVYNGAVRSYLATTTSIGSISALSAGNQTAALTPHSNVRSRLRNARVPETAEFEQKQHMWQVMISEANLILVLLLCFTYNKYCQ